MQKEEKIVKLQYVIIYDGEMMHLISFHHSRLLHTAIWQVFILQRHKKESIFHHIHFIN